MINDEYSKAYTEVLEILKYVSKSEFDKIPNDKIEFYQKNKDKEYNYKLDKNLEFEKQNMLEITKAILANIFRDYWATEYQKERILAKEKCDVEQLENEKKEKYNQDNIFKNKKQEEQKHTQELALIEYKEQNFFRKLLTMIMSFFK